MSDQTDKNSPQSRVKKHANRFWPLTIVMSVLLLIGVYFFWQENPFTSRVNNPKGSTNSSDKLQPALESPPVTDSAKEKANSLHDQNANQAQESLSISETQANADNQEPNAERMQTENFAPPASGGTSDQNSLNQTPTANPQVLVEEINSFFTHVDEQPYIKPFGLKESSKAHFIKLLQKLVDNPPVVIRETDDLYTLLQNTAHFFRILGKDNINLLKAMLSNEQNSFEEVLNAFYRLTSQPDLLKKEYSLSIPAHALTDYAGFFLNTIGGRMYLFRRDSTSRMVVSYYSIITIDRANVNGDGGHGIDLRPAIRSLIDDIETGGSRLQFKNDYLETLYNLEEKYN